MYLVIQWAVEHYPISKSTGTRTEELSVAKIEAQRQLRNLIRELTGSDVVANNMHHIAQIRHPNVFTELKIRKILSDINFTDSAETRNRRIRKRLAKVQNLYRIISETLSDGYLRYQIDMIGYGVSQQRYQPSQEMQFHDDRQQHQMSKEKLSPSKHPKYMVRVPGGDYGEVQRSQDSIVEGQR